MLNFSTVTVMDISNHKLKKSKWKNRSWKFNV